MDKDTVFIEREGYRIYPESAIKTAFYKTLACVNDGQFEVDAYYDDFLENLNERT